MSTTQSRTPAIATEITGTTLALTFADGEVFTLDATTLTGEVQTYAMMHGLKQKLVDAAAISRDPVTGRAATIATKRTAVREVFDRLISGQWNKVREGGTATTGGLLYMALCRLYADKTPERIKEFLAGKSDAEKAAMRKNPKVADIIEQIKLEQGRDGDGTPGEDILNELEGM